MALLELKNISKKYVIGTETIHALRTITLSIHKGEYVALMGPSGSGKSTLMNIVGCLDTPTGGAYTLNGKEVTFLILDQGISIPASLPRSSFGERVRQVMAVAANTVVGETHTPLSEQHRHRETLIAGRLDVNESAGRVGVQG